MTTHCENLNLAQLLQKTEKEKYIKLGVIEEIRHNCIALYIPKELKDEAEHIVKVFDANMYKLV